jgi:spermidine synthase
LNELDPLSVRQSMTQANLQEPAGARPLPPFLPVLLVLFVGSGCAALIYEIVWLQLLQLVIGSTAVSLGVLLGTFMGGMCLGSLLLPRFVSVCRHPLRVYALLEIGIGVIGLAVLFGMPLVEQVYSLYGGHGLPGILLRGLVTGVCLLPPTLLMGATLPAIARWVETSPAGVSWLGFFYGGNIAGAVFGCLLAGFYLLRVHDVAIATYTALAINGAVAIFALILAAATTEVACPENWVAHPSVSSKGVAAATTPFEDSGRATRRSVDSRPSPLLRRSLYLVIALSGMSALGAEVVWTRLLSLLLGGTVYTFSIILAVFLIGLGIGSSIAALLARTQISPRMALGVCQLLLIGAIAWTALMISQSLPYWPINPGLSPSPWYTFQLDMARCLWALLLPACLWGASFPLTLAAVAARGQDGGRLVGGVYAANTIGAIAGALLFSLVVIPWIGTLGAQQALIGLVTAAAILALAPLLWLVDGPGRRPSPERIAGIAVTLIVALVSAGGLAWTLTPIPWGLVGYGRYFATWPDLMPGIVAEANVSQGSGNETYCLYLGEGMNVSVVVSLTRAGVKSFHGAGKVQASTGWQDMRLQRMLGHLSALLHRKPEKVLVVACGAGVTAGTFVVHPDVERIVICDIEKLVPTTVTPMFSDKNYHIVDGIAEHNPRTIRVLDQDFATGASLPATPTPWLATHLAANPAVLIKDKQVDVVYDDGRHYIRTSKEKFDIITSDPIDPWVKGCAALNTVEYYQMCKEHLKPGGIMSLWIPLYESNLDTTKSVIATFFQVFPNGILWSNESNGEGYDAVLFGQAEPTVIDVDELEKRLERPDHYLVKQSLEEYGFGARTTTQGTERSANGVAIDLLSSFAGQAADFGDWAQDAQINTDRNLRLQYLAGMWLNSNKGAEILANILTHYRFPDRTFVGSPGRIQALKNALAAVGRKE